MSLLDTTYPKPVTPWQCAGHVPLPKTVSGRVNRLGPINRPRVHVPLQERIRRILAEGPSSIPDLRNELSGTKSTVFNAVKRMLASGEIVVHGTVPAQHGGERITLYRLREKGDD